METFATKLDDNPIEITVKTSSSAIMTGPNKVFITIYNEDSPSNWRKVNVDETVPDKEFKASVKKLELKDRPIIRIKSKFAVDDIDLKESIVKTTRLSYKLKDDTGNQEGFHSNYTDNKSEYKLGSSSDGTFAVVKRIKVELQ